MVSLTLKAVYSAAGATQTFEHEIPASNAEPLAAKQAHLTALQTLVPQLQDQINVFLTARMEEDKGKISEKDAKEEANYGEEVVGRRCMNVQKIYATLGIKTTLETKSKPQMLATRNECWTCGSHSPGVRQCCLRQGQT